MPILPTLRLFGLALLVVPGCIEPNLDHCGRNDGDRSCAQASAETPYCSVCVAENHGCIAAPAAPACQAYGGASESASITGTTTTTTTTTTTSDSSSTDPSTTTGEPPESCGDGVVDVGEQCDEEDLGDASCEKLGFGGGVLGCTESCEFDKSGCCLGENAECDLLAPPECCPGLTCSLAGGLDTLTTCR